MPTRLDTISMGVPAIGPDGGQSVTSLTLNTAYVFGVSGTAVLNRFVAAVTAQLTDVYFFVTSIAGATAQIRVELRNMGATGTTVGSTLHAVQTVSQPAGINQWVRCTFSTPFTVIKNVPYFLVIGVTNGSGAVSIGVLRTGSFGSGVLPSISIKIDAPFTSANGGTAITAQNGPPPIIKKFADGSVMGSPYNTNPVTSASTTREHGLKIINLSGPLTVGGFGSSGTASGMNGLKIYKGDVAPGSVPDMQITITQPFIGMYRFDPYTFQPNTIYRLVFTYSSAAGVPQYIPITDYATFADVQLARMYGGAIIETIEDGVGGWSDSNDRVSLTQMYLAQPSGAAFLGPVGPYLIRGMP